MAETYEIMAEEYLMAYIQVLNEAPECDPAAKTAKEKAYARGLIENGGPAIDQLKKYSAKPGPPSCLKSICFKDNQRHPPHGRMPFFAYFPTRSTSTGMKMPPWTLRPLKCS